MLYTVDDCKKIKINEIRPNILSFYNNKTIPFVIKRIYYLYDIAKEETRGAHAHKQLFQLLIAAAGTFNVELDDANKKQIFCLNNPSEGLLIVPGIWRNLTNFSVGSVALVLVSEYYTEDDYIRNYEDFMVYRRCQNV